MSTCVACCQAAQLVYPEVVRVRDAEHPPRHCQACADAIDAAEPEKLAELRAFRQARPESGGDLAEAIRELPPGVFDRIRMAAEAKAWHDLIAANAPAPPLASIESKILDYDGLMSQPDPEPLIDDVLDLDSTNWIIGQPGSYKSFFALDWACHVATGRDWRGKGVRRGVVLYLAAEGARGIKRRVAAWAKKHGQVPQDLRVLPVAVTVIQRLAYGQFGQSPEWRQLIEAAREMGAVMIVLDTQARLSDGLNENDAGEMGAWIKAVDDLKRATGAAVLIVHHTTKTGETERGSGAIRGAADRTWQVDKSGRGALLRNPKSKDSDDSEMFSVDMEVIDLGADERGRPISSLVLGTDKVRAAFTSAPTMAEMMRRRDIEARSLTNQRWIVQTLRGQDDPNGGGSTRSDLWRAYVDLSRDEPDQMSRTIFFATITDLLTPREDPLRPGETYQLIYETTRGRRLTLSDPEGGMSGLDRGYIENLSSGTTLDSCSGNKSSSVSSVSSGNPWTTVTSANANLSGELSGGKSVRPASVHGGPL